MTQVSSYTIADADGLTVLADINAKLAAIQSLNSGTTGPSSPVTGMPWLDTSGSTPVRRRRNAANSGWDLDDLPAVGMGVTSVTAVASCDALTLAGVYLASSGATGAPVGGTAFIIYHGVGATSSDAVQEAFALGSDRAFTRRKVAGTWQAWVESAIGASVTGLAVLQAANGAAARTAMLAYGSTDLASAGDIAAGTANKIVDAAQFKAACVFTKAFTSSQQTLTSAGALTLAHGLGIAPKFLRFTNVCQTAEFGYSVADEVEVSVNASNAGTTRDHSVVCDATNINVRFCSDTTLFIIGHKSTGAASFITTASWKFVVRAFA